MHNQFGIGLISHKRITSDTKRTETSQTMDVTRTMTPKGNRRVQTTIKRMGTRTDKVDLTVALHLGETGIKKVFHTSWRTLS